MYGDQALERFLSIPGIRTVLDIGSGEGHQAQILRERHKEVTTISLIPPADFVGDYLKWNGSAVDGIWACHVLEHQPNPGFFLKKCFRDLNEYGVLAVTVPPAKDAIVGGHLGLWNAGLLLYHLILAGFDCSEAMVATYGYNISVIVHKKEADLPDDLLMDSGDIAKLAGFFPMTVMQSFDGRITSLNWTP